MGSLRAAVVVIVLALVAGCASLVEQQPSPPKLRAWKIGGVPASVTYPVVTRYLFVAPPRTDASIEQVTTPGDVNGDGAPDLRLRYREGSTFHSVVVLSGSTVPNGSLGRWRGRVVGGTGQPPRSLALRIASYRRARLPDLDGDGIPERARLATRHWKTEFACGEGSRCTEWDAASELTLRSGGKTIARIGGDWYPAAPVDFAASRNHSVIGGYEPAGDWNDDGRPDLLYDNPTFGVLILMFTRGGARAQRVPGVYWNTMPAVVDLDGDGRPELVGETASPSAGRYAGWLTLAIVTPR